MNKVFVIGRLTADPTVRDNNGVNICNFSVAADTRSKDADGNTITNFYRVSVWRQQGDNCAKYLHKGDRVAVTGDQVLRSFVDKNGQTRSSLEIPYVDSVEFLTEKRDAAAQAPSAPAYTRNPVSAPMPGAMDDLPF